MDSSPGGLRMTGALVVKQSEEAVFVFRMIPYQKALILSGKSDKMPSFNF